MLKTLVIFSITAFFEILGCFLVFLWLKKNGSPWLLPLGAICLMLFVYLLTWHPVENGRIYAAYGGVYIVAALLWLRYVDNIKLTTFDWAGTSIILLGTCVLIAGWRQ